jgi:hypothetical protein
VTLYNYRPTATGHPRLLVHVSNDTLGTAGKPNPNPMVGVLTKVTGDLGNKLTINQVGQPADGSLTSLSARLKKHWRVKGVGHDFLKAVCDDSTHKLNYKAIVTFNNTGARAGEDFSRCS